MLAGDARGMTRRRCTECARRFEAAATAAKSQKVCGPECRLARRRRQDKERRQAALDGYRAEERVRQRACRARRAVDGGASVTECHGPASDAKRSKSQLEIGEIVAETFRRSRTGFERELRRMVREIRPFMTVTQAGGGP